MDNSDFVNKDLSQLSPIIPSQPSANPLNSFDVMILYRSLYILKRKFEMYKETIYSIYKKYETIQKSITNVQVKVSIDNFENILTEIFATVNSIIITISSPKDAITSNLVVTEDKRNQMTRIIHQIYLFAKDKIDKYNHLFYEKKIKVMTDQALRKAKETAEIEDMTSFPMVEYDKKGNIVKTYNQLLNDNISFPNQDLVNGVHPRNDVLKDKDASVNMDLHEVPPYQQQSLLMNNLGEGVLYIETTPLIIADFLQENSFYVLIETGDDLLGELSTLFDREIISKLEQKTKMEKEKELQEAMQIPQKKELVDCIKQRYNVKQNIKLYEKLLLEKKDKGENTIFIEDMLEKLLAQKIWLEHKIKFIKDKEQLIPNSDMQIAGSSSQSSFINKDMFNNSRLKPSSINSNNSNINSNVTRIQSSSANRSFIANAGASIVSSAPAVKTKEEKRLFALKEIFTFYTTQHNLVGQTFEAVQSKKDHLDLSEFSKFCNEFNLPITRQKLVEVFKKTTSNLRTMTFKEFQKALDKLALAINESKKAYIVKTITAIREQVNAMEVKEAQRQEEEKRHNIFTEKNTGLKQRRALEKNQFSYLSKHKKCLEEISTNKYELERMERKTYQQIMEDFYTYISVDKESEYRKKMKGFNIPFQTYDKQYRIPKKTLENKVQDRSEIKELIELKKKEKEKYQMAQELIKKDLMFQHKKQLFESNNKKLGLHNSIRLRDKTYGEALRSKRELMIEKERQLALIKEKQEEEKRSKISWDKLNEIDLEDLHMNDNDKEFFLETYNSDDDELIAHLGLKKDNNNSNTNTNTNNNKKLARNNSAAVILPSITVQ